jgi:ubiquinone/menaquinone biosynthesis C-methylase UbiE
MKNLDKIEENIKCYLKERPALLAPLRGKEAYLFQQYLPFKNPVLDVGCGDGFFAEVILGNKGLIDVGLDIKGSRIDEAKGKSVYKTTIKYNGRCIPYPNNSFATIISNSTFEHILDLESVLKELYRVLKPNGILLITVIAEPWAENYFGNRIFGNLYKIWMTKLEAHLNLFNHNKWDDAFRKAGFKILKKIGHAKPEVSAWTDVLHYFGILNLLSYKIFGTWVLIPLIAENLFPVKYFASIMSKNASLNDATAIFYELKK